MYIVRFDKLKNNKPTNGLEVLIKYYDTTTHEKKYSISKVKKFEDNILMLESYPYKILAHNVIGWFYTDELDYL